MTERLNLDRLVRRCPQIKRMEMGNPQAHDGNPNKGTAFILEEFATRVKDASLLEDVRVVASEMISNASYHGNKLDPEKKIKIHCGWVGHDFYGVVQDEGKGFNIDKPIYHTDPPEGGMGIGICRNKVDLLYNFGNTVFFVKRVI